MSMLQHRIRANEERYRLPQNRQTSVFKIKKHDYDKLEQLTIRMGHENYYARKGFLPLTDMCRDLDDNFLTDEKEVFNRWKGW